MRPSLLLMLLLLLLGCKERKNSNANAELQPINIPTSNAASTSGTHDDDFSLLEHYFQQDSAGRLETERNIPPSLIAKLIHENEALPLTFKLHPILRVANEHGYNFVIEYNFGSYSGVFYLLQFDRDRRFIARSEVGSKSSAGDDILDFTCEQKSSDTLRTHMVRYYRNDKKPLDTIVRDFALGTIPVRDQMNFLDSVIFRSDLSSDQVRAYPIADKYINKTNAFSADPFFSGETVYFANKEHAMAIIEYGYDDCDGKYLVVFRSKDMKNTDCKKVVVDCRVEDHTCGDRTFDIVNDSSFYIKEWQTKKLRNDSIQIIHTVSLCTINKKGKIEVKEENEVFNKKDKDSE